MDFHRDGTYKHLPSPSFSELSMICILSWTAIKRIINKTETLSPHYYFTEEANKAWNSDQKYKQHAQEHQELEL